MKVTATGRQTEDSIKNIFKIAHSVLNEKFGTVSVFNANIYFIAYDKDGVRIPDNTEIIIKMADNHQIRPALTSAGKEKLNAIKKEKELNQGNNQPEEITKIELPYIDFDEESITKNGYYNSNGNIPDQKTSEFIEKINSISLQEDEEKELQRTAIEKFQKAKNAAAYIAAQKEQAEIEIEARKINDEISITKEYVKSSPSVITEKLNSIVSKVWDEFYPEHKSTKQPHHPIYTVKDGKLIMTYANWQHEKTMAHPCGSVSGYYKQNISSLWQHPAWENATQRIRQMLQELIHPKS